MTAPSHKLLGIGRLAATWLGLSLLSLTLGCEYVLITRGEDGMSLFRKGDGAVHIPTVAREVYDVTGAGDTVVAAISLAIAAGADLVLAAHLANHAAGIVVGKIGTATVTVRELLAEIREHPGWLGPRRGSKVAPTGV